MRSTTASKVSTPARDSDVFPARQGRLQVGRTRRSERGDDVVITAFHINDDSLGKSVFIFESFFDLGQYARGDGDDGPHNAQLSSSLQQSGDPRLGDMQRVCNVHLAYAAFVIHPGHLGDEPELTVGRGSRHAARRCCHGTILSGE